VSHIIFLRSDFSSIQLSSFYFHQKINYGGMVFVSEILDGSTTEKTNNGLEPTMDMKRRPSLVPTHHNSRQMNNNHHSTTMSSAPAVRIEPDFSP